MRTSAGQFASVWLGAASLVAGGCFSSDESASRSDGLRTFDLEVVGSDLDSLPDPEPELPEGLGLTSAVIIEAPAIVSASEAFEVMIELRNGATEAAELSPCPWFSSAFGESGTVSLASGQLPCEEIGSIGAGERIRLRLPMTAPAQATAGEVGWAELTWRIGDIRAGIPMPMEGLEASVNVPAHKN